MRILLTGGTGMIGQAVGKTLVMEGHEVITVSRDREEAQKKLSYPARILEWADSEYNLSPADASALKGVDAVVHLMGENVSEKRWTKTFKESLVRSRVNSTRALIRQVIEQGTPKVWIQASASGFYGNKGTNTSVDELSPPGKDFLANLCIHWENALDELPESTRRVILRTGVVLTHQGGAVSRLVPMYLQGIGGRIASGDQHMSLIHLDDVVRFISHALNSVTTKGAYNLTLEKPVTQRTMSAELARHLGVKEGPPVPALALRALVGEMSEALLANQPVISHRLQEARFELKYPDLNRALKEVTSWFQHPLQPGKAVLAFYSEQYIPAKKASLFSFFSKAENLEEITPEWLHFQIVNASDSEIKAGSEIKYKLRVHGVPMHWLTRIEVWNPGEVFVDNQLSGPYRLWYHEHRFQDLAQGTLMKDWVRFELPLGRLGSLGRVLIEKDVGKIFAHRRLVIHQKFNS